MAVSISLHRMMKAVIALPLLATKVDQSEMRAMLASRQPTS